MDNTRRLLIILLLATLPLTGVAAKLYRWVDADGKTHYTDRIPPDAAKQARSRLNARGVEVEQTDAAKSLEQIMREREIERLRAEKQRLIEVQQAKDRVLLRTFRSEDDILMTRDGKTSSIDTSIQIVRTNIRRLKLKLADMQKNAADLERQGETISKNYLKDIESTRQQLKESYATIIGKEQIKEDIRNKYAADIKRFLELKELNPQQQISQQQRSSSLLETVVTCTDDKRCNQAWVKAEAYVRQHATTRLQMLANSIIMTAAPLRDNDISITVSRIREQGQPGAKLFMDLQCRETPRGRDLCKSDQVEAIRNGWQGFVGAE